MPESNGFIEANLAGRSRVSSGRRVTASLGRAVDRWSDEAIDGLVGQRFTLRWGDRTTTAEVLAASRGDDDQPLITYEVPADWNLPLDL